MKSNAIVLWALRIIPAIILLQTLFFKFTGAPESVAIFTKLGVEPWGRWVTGIMELVAAIMLIWPITTAYGALLGVGVMSGAIFSHLTVLGIESAGDGGQLFVLAIVTWICCTIQVILYRKNLLGILKSARS